MATKTGKQSYTLTKPVYIHDRASIVGQMEKDGPLGEYFEIDPTLIRLGFVLFSMAGGSGLLAYLIATIVMPKHAMIDELK